MGDRQSCLSGQAGLPVLHSPAPPLLYASAEVNMLLTIAIIILVLWALGFIAFHVTSYFIHVLIVIAIILFILHFVRGGRPVV